MNRDTLKRIACLVAVFAAGGIVFANLTVMRYGVPEHYHANYGKVVFAIVIAIMFGTIAIDQSK